jgi:hypothetical protein
VSDPERIVAEAVIKVQLGEARKRVENGPFASRVFETLQDIDLRVATSISRFEVERHGQVGCSEPAGRLNCLRQICDLLRGRRRGAIEVVDASSDADFPHRLPVEGKLGIAKAAAFTGFDKRKRHGAVEYERPLHLALQVRNVDALNPG